MSHEVLASTDTTVSALIGGGTNDGGVFVLFEMYEKPVVLGGNPTPEQLTEIESISVNVFN